MKEVTLLNPYSVSLKKDPFITVIDQPIYTNGDFKIYKYYPNHFLHTYKNIVIAERCGANKELITNLTGETSPKDKASKYHQLERPRTAMIEGIEAAKKLHFEII